MARHYSTKDFFRQMPNVLLARYFQARKLMGDVDFAGEAWTSIRNREGGSRWGCTT